MPDADCTPCNVKFLLIIILYRCLMCAVESHEDIWGQHASEPCWKLCEDACKYLQTLAALAFQTGYSRLHVLDIGKAMG